MSTRSAARPRARLASAPLRACRALRASVSRRGEPGGGYSEDSSGRGYSEDSSGRGVQVIAFGPINLLLFSIQKGLTYLIGCARY